MERRPSTNWCEDPPRQDPNRARPVSPSTLTPPAKRTNADTLRAPLAMERAA